MKGINTFLKYFVIIFWPLSLYLANTRQNFLEYLLPLLLLLVSFFLHTKKFKEFYLLLLLIPFIEIKLIPFSLMFLLGIFVLKKLANNKNNKLLLFSLIFLITISFVKRTDIIGQTILIPDYEKQQEVLREIHLYPNVFTARLFQNKARIVLDKYLSNLLALTDPNNYFFSFHPGEGNLVNQNLAKFPYLSIIPMLIGSFNLKRYKYFSFILLAFCSGVISLSLMTNFDRHDFILWLPLSLTFLFGMDIISKMKGNFKHVFVILFFITSLFELIRILYQY
ncbi:MAG: hypothetical protein US60_C0001G0015 [Microgenomates group bacterium GW2011_GWC1_37_8]|uniref:Glycosyltransferase RgtA/B/C/D-like domain-containing protein n=1 Tax=Candidatus Woesebacteria bacterium GW2011_GWB1_38_8 TaxID=1618570 RepID=A0A0G0L2M6_9BACT|nr:MAG: hypothetical protein US60_C0001G0015 [Microgenomates group bacterium GW2011_GWC1_37_8]KKQ86218.1 MAG: hypothetical protein UT08_C0001G0084 [Candidatus Woesebacteria bacterium GW2011_GWB1_38_8]